MSEATDFAERQSEAKRAYRERNRINLDTQGGILGGLSADPFSTARTLAGRASEAGDISRDIFSGIFGEGGTDFGGIAEGLLKNIEGVSQSERDVAFRGIDEEAGRATANASNRLGQFGDMDPEQFTRVAGDIDVGRLRARGETEARFAGMDRETKLGMLRSLPGLMGAQNQQQGEFGGFAMNLLKSAPINTRNLGGTGGLIHGGTTGSAF